jgi:hypothetical protein
MKLILINNKYKIINFSHNRILINHKLYKDFTLILIKILTIYKDH